MVEVRENLQTLFKADDTQLARLFSGRPVVIRRNLDEAAASHYQQLMERAGAVVQVRNASDSKSASGDKKVAPSAEKPEAEQGRRCQ